MHHTRATQVASHEQQALVSGSPINWSCQGFDVHKGPELWEGILGPDPDQQSATPAQAHRGKKGHSSNRVDANENKVVSNEAARPHLGQGVGSRGGGARGDLIVVASLLENAVNLAGLSRTCEVFRAGLLVVPDLRVQADPIFQGISVTAEKWVPMIEVRVFDCCFSCVCDLVSVLLC